MTRYLDADLKQQWVDALRSGEYKQGMEGNLRSKDDEFCCLGILCDLIPGVEWDDLGPGAYSAVVTWQHEEPARRNSALVPDSLAAQLGLSREYRGDEPICNGDHCDYGRYTQVQRHLAAMNDRGYSFDEIAGWIERNVESESRD